MHRIGSVCILKFKKNFEISTILKFKFCGRVKTPKVDILSVWLTMVIVYKFMSRSICQGRIVLFKPPCC